MKTVIYGAQGYALGTYKAISYLYPEKEIIGFVVTEMGNNASTLAGLPVFSIADFKDKYPADTCEFYIATPVSVQDEIEKTLAQYGYTNYVRVDDFQWSQIMNQYYAANNELMPLSTLSIGSEIPIIKNYVACSNFDKELKEKYSWPNYSVPIHLGNQGKDSFNATVFDSTGDNISKKNPNYCELTALYWLWKNDILNNGSTADYYGLCHYRRFLMISDSDLKRIAENDIDVVLPYPLYYEPDIEAHRKRYIKDDDWKALLKAIEELYPDIISTVQKVLLQEKLFNYNMILAKRQVLEDYCNWLFPILECVEELSIPIESERADRYIGYMGETLETIYFMANKDKLKIVFVGSRLLL